MNKLPSRCLHGSLPRNPRKARIALLFLAAFAGAVSLRPGPLTADASATADYLAAADGSAAAPSARAIVYRAVDKAEAQYEAQREARYESVALSTIQSLDAENQPTKTEIFRYRQHPLAGALFEELIEKNGRSLTPKEKRAEEKRRRDFVREVEKRRSLGLHPQPEREPGIRFNHEFVDRYELKLRGEETIRGHRCWVIAFEPRPGRLPVRNRMDRALNQSTGKLWIAQEDYGAVRIEFSLKHPFKYWGGLLAVIRNTEGRMEYERVEKDYWAAHGFEIKLDLEIMMVKNIRRSVTKSWSGYRTAGRRGENRGGPGKSARAGS